MAPGHTGATATAPSMASLATIDTSSSVYAPTQLLNWVYLTLADQNQTSTSDQVPSKILPAVWSPFPTAQAYNYNYYSNGSLSGGLTGLNSSLSESVEKIILVIHWNQGFILKSIHFKQN